MRRRHSLRLRVAAAFALFGALVSVVLALSLQLAAHEVSQRLIDQTLRAELDDYMSRRARNPASPPPATATFRGYVRAGTGDAHIPPAVRDLSPGRHEIEIDNVPYRVAVEDRGAERFYILFNEERQRAREQRFRTYLVAGAMLMVMLSAAGSVWLAGRVIAPVTGLAHAVSEADPENPPRLVAEDEPRDEVGELTRAFERYLERLHAFIDRERAFAADASHELRTPLAVIRGAADVLAEDERLDEAQRARVARIGRAAAEMSELIAGLLLLAREDDAPTEEACDAARVVRETVERIRASAATRGTVVELAIEAQPQLEVPPALFAIVVGNLVRNAVAHGEGAAVSVRLQSERLTVSDAGVGIPGEELGRVFQRYYRGAASRGAGIGLSLVKRICDRNGWEILLESRPGAGTTATLSFATSSLARGGLTQT